jgi:ribonuclease HII
MPVGRHRPTGSGEGRQGPTGSGEGRERPTESGEGRQGPAGSGEGRQRPTGSGEGRQRPAGSDKGSAAGKRRKTAGRLFRFDRSFGRRFIAGADEAGRGSLAGPLVAAAVLFDYATLTRKHIRALRSLDDSKAHDVEGREHLYPIVLEAATRVAVTSRCAQGIDHRGLHVTNLAALRDCLARVACADSLCLVDGFAVPPFDAPQQAVIDGDARSAAVAAASVVAKVVRDRYMRRVAEELPGWHFHTNVGYSTPEHREAILARGITWLHRRSFDSVAYQQLQI